MRCPQCGARDSRVVDSRDLDDAATIRRRRECAACSNRFTTYVIAGKAGSGTIGVNGAAARLTQVGHRVIIMAFVHADAQEVARHKSRVVIVDKANKPVETVEHPSALDGSSR